MWQGEPLRPPQWRHLMSLGVQCIVDGDLQRQGAGAGTGQTEHERGSTRLTRGCVRAVRVVGAAGHDRVQFPVHSSCRSVAASRLWRAATGFGSVRASSTSAGVRVRSAVSPSGGLRWRPTSRRGRRSSRVRRSGWRRPPPGRSRWLLPRRCGVGRACRRSRSRPVAQAPTRRRPGRRISCAGYGSGYPARRRTA
jgi:hypothetical protein